MLTQLVLPIAWQSCTKTVTGLNLASYRASWVLAAHFISASEKLLFWLLIFFPESGCESGKT